MFSPTGLFMKSLFCLLALFLCLPTIAKAGDGFTNLTNGKDLTGWKVVGGNGKFEMINSEIVGSGVNVETNTFLISEKYYRNFDFRFEMKFDTLKGNSGMMFRGRQRENGRVYGYQCEHDNRKERAWTAGLFDESRRGWLFPAKDDKEETDSFTEQGQKLMNWDKWNQIRIRCIDAHIEIWLNGEKRVDFHDTDKKHFTPQGFLGMQVHSGDQTNVRWRNLRIKELP